MLKTEPAAKTIDQAIKIRPALGSLLRTFEPLISARRATAEKLAPVLEQSSARLVHDPETQSAYVFPVGLGPYIREAAMDMLPLLLEQDALKPYAASLEALFLDPDADEKRERLLAACLSGTDSELLALGQESGIAADVLVFAADFIVSAVARALALRVPEESLKEWGKSRCPVCGSMPIIAWLGRPDPERSEFLASGGGKKHLHCGFCGIDWPFLRGVCPGCGAHGADAMQILGEEDRRHERIDWCKKCGSYLPLIDLREMLDTPDMDAMALCLMHLDIVAAEKELAPLKPTFWNMF